MQTAAAAYILARQLVAAMLEGKIGINAAHRLLITHCGISEADAEAVLRVFLFKRQDV
jgi:hypothetical protein